MRGRENLRQMPWQGPVHTVLCCSSPTPKTIALVRFLCDMRLTADTDRGRFSFHRTPELVGKYLLVFVPLGTYPYRKIGIYITSQYSATRPTLPPPSSLSSREHQTFIVAFVAGMLTPPLALPTLSLFQARGLAEGSLGGEEEVITFPSLKTDACTL